MSALVIDRTSGSTDTSTGRVLENVRAGVEAGGVHDGISISWRAQAANDLSRQPVGSHYLMDWEPWIESQSPDIGDYAETFDDDLLDLYNNTYYIPAMEYLDPIAEARNIKCSVYQYPSLFRRSGSKWVANDAGQLAFQRQVLDKCENDGLLNYFRNGRWEIAIAAYTNTIPTAADWNVPGNTDFLDLIENLANALTEYAVSFSFLLRIKADGSEIWTPTQQLAVYKKAASLAKRWVRGTDGALSYESVNFLALWEQNVSDGGQTASTIDAVVADAAPAEGYPYQHTPDVPVVEVGTSLASRISARNVMKDAVIYLGLSDTHQQPVLYSPRASGPHGILSGVDALPTNMTTDGPRGSRAIHFNGVDQVAWLPVDEALDGATAWSGSMWLKKTAPAGTEYVAAHWRTANLRTLFRLYVEADGRLRLQVARNLQGSSTYTYTTASDVCDGEWHCIQWTMSAGLLTLYVDGVAEVTDAEAVSALMNPAAAGLFGLGSNVVDDAFDEFSEVSFAGFGVWDRSLSANELTLLRNHI